MSTFSRHQCSQFHRTVDLLNRPQRNTDILPNRGLLDLAFRRTLISNLVTLILNNNPLQSFLIHLKTTYPDLLAAQHRDSTLLLRRIQLSLSTTLISSRTS